MNAPSRPLIALALTALIAAGGFLTGCEVDSANSVERSVGVDFTGVYGPNTDQNPSNRNIIVGVNRPVVQTLDLRQAGDRLEAIDDRGSLWTGSIGDVSGDSGSERASFELIGNTPDTGRGRFSGNLIRNGGEARMTGTYIASGFYATFVGVTDFILGDSGDGGGGGGGLNATANPQNITINGGTSQLTVTGGTSPYTWSVSPVGLGSISPTAGSTVTYTRNAPGNVTITVTDAASNVDTVTITQP